MIKVWNVSIAQNIDVEIQACFTAYKIAGLLLQDGSLPFARSISDTQSEFRLLSKLTELLMKHGDQEEALQYATLAVQIAGNTGSSRHGASRPTPEDGSLSSEETIECFSLLFRCHYQ